MQILNPRIIIQEASFFRKLFKVNYVVFLRYALKVEIKNCRSFITQHTMKISCSSQTDVKQAVEDVKRNIDGRVSVIGPTWIEND